MRTQEEAQQIFALLQKQKYYSEAKKEKRLVSLMTDEEIITIKHDHNEIVGVIEFSKYTSLVHGLSGWMTVSCLSDSFATTKTLEQVKQLLHSFKCDGVSMVSVTVNDQDETVLDLLKQVGFDEWYGYVSMKHDGSTQPKSTLQKRVIQPEDFKVYCDVMGSCFVPMREAMDIRPYNVAEIFFNTEAKMQETYDEWLNNQQLTFMYEKDGQWVGSGLLINEEIDDVFVVESFQGQGYGREIVYDLIHEAYKQGFTPDIGYVKWNQRAGNLYESCGFVPYLHQTMMRIFL